MAKVDAKGKVTGVKNGSCTIYTFCGGSFDAVGLTVSGTATNIPDSGKKPTTTTTKLTDRNTTLTLPYTCLLYTSYRAVYSSHGTAFFQMVLFYRKAAGMTRVGQYLLHEVAPHQMCIRDRSYYATILHYGSKLSVGQVSRVKKGTLTIGVAGEERPLHQFHHIPESRFR